jgi:oxygen-dependent protoporphyrinogen oxidase
VETTAGKPLPFTPTHVISAIPLPALNNIVNIPPSPPHSQSSSGGAAPYALPHLDAKTNPASSVLVINLVFPPSPSSSSSLSSSSNLLHPDGFGYLVPRPLPSPDGDGYLTQEETDKRARKDMKMFGEVNLSQTILGTIFDSAICFPGEAEHDENDKENEDGTRKGRQTRLTIMLGGPHPLPEIVTSLFSSPSESSATTTNQSTLSWSPSTTSAPETKTKTLKNGAAAGDEAALRVFLPPLLRTLARTLSSQKNKNHNDLLAPHAFDEPFELGLPPPLYVQAHYHKDCIPTYAPGHLRRMDELRAALGFVGASSSSSSSSSFNSSDAGAEGSLWRGRMHVIGAGVGGVSLGDCVTQGRDAAFAVVRQVQEQERQQKEPKRN